MSQMIAKMSHAFFWRAAWFGNRQTCFKKSAHLNWIQLRVSRLIFLHMYVLMLNVEQTSTRWKNVFGLTFYFIIIQPNAINCLWAKCGQHHWLLLPQLCKKTRRQIVHNQHTVRWFQTFTYLIQVTIETAQLRNNTFKNKAKK